MTAEGAGDGRGAAVQPAASCLGGSPPPGAMLTSPSSMASPRSLPNLRSSWAGEGRGGEVAVVKLRQGCEPEAGQAQVGRAQLLASSRLSWARALGSSPDSGVLGHTCPLPGTRLKASG